MDNQNDLTEYERCRDCRYFAPEYSEPCRVLFPLDDDSHELHSNEPRQEGFKMTPAK